METVQVKIEGIAPLLMIVPMFLLLLTASCGGSQKYWTKPNFHQTEFDKDNQECSYEGQKQGAVEGRGSSIQAFNEGNTARITATNNCMRSRGYTLTDKPNP
jgi:hypothetical protein